MQKQKIPVTLDVKKAAMHDTCYEGYIVLAQLKRLTSSLGSDEGNVDVKVQTGVDEQGLNFLKGQAQVTISLTCQRCNETMPVDLTTDFAFSPVKIGYVEDEENQLPDHYDPIMINEFGEIGLRDLVEDELILDIPLIAMHDEQDCPATGSNMTWGKIEEEVVEQKPNPFAVLKQLKRN
jgi:uncharacterized protein